MISDIIKYFHYFSTTFLFFGFLLPEKYLGYYLLFVVILRVHWLTNNNSCILTELEEKYSNKKIEITTTKYPFMTRMGNEFGFYFNDDQYIMIFDYGLSLILCYTLFKYYCYKTKQNII
jgi:hypothetical protein